MIKWFAVLIILMSLFVMAILAFAEQEWTDEEICEAIFWSEGGYDTRYPYGIKSVSCKGIKGCKIVCLRTIRSNRKRYADYGHKDYGSYLEFLASRYAPIGASNDPTNLNKNWLTNVKWFLNNEK